MKNFILTLLLCFFGMAFTNAQTVLTPGDIAIIGFNTDDADVIRFVTMVDIAQGTQIKFTDNGWNGTALTNTEGTDTWTATTAYSRGTVFSLSVSSMALSTSGDQIFAYQGAASAPVFIYGVSTNPWVAGSISSTTSRKPASLVTGTSCIAFSPERDNGRYTPVNNTGDKAALLALIGSSSNWSRTDTRISTFPAWVFTVTGGPTPEPVAQPTNLVFSGVKSYRYALSFNAASPAPAGYLVLRSIAGVPSADPADGVIYTVGQTLGNAVVMSAGNTTSLTDESVRANTTYHYRIYSYTGTGNAINYRQVAPLAGTVVSNANEIGTYYNGIDPLNASFVSDLQNRVRNPFVKVAYDQYDETMMTRFAFEYAPAGQRTATCSYSGLVYAYTAPFVWYTASPFSREHTWCVSWTPSEATSGDNEYCDQHHLFPVNQNDANAVRSNHPLGVVVTPTDVYLEGKLGYDVSGNLVYEPRNAQKGDAARAMLYMSMRYNGVDGFNWTFNHLNNVILPALGEDPQDVALLIQWHNQDLPDSYEIARNDYIQSIQQNRNPFIDYPSWVNYIDFNNLTWTGAAMPQLEQSSAENVTRDPEVLLWPNPASDITNLSIVTESESIAEVCVVDLAGRVIHREQMTVINGMNNFSFDTSSWTRGMYIVCVRSDGWQQHLELLKN
jgi:endonuclease I